MSMSSDDSDVGEKRVPTSSRVLPSKHKLFIEDCHKLGRKSCDMQEAWYDAVHAMVNKLEDDGVLPCPFTPLVIKIESLNVERKYPKRGPVAKGDPVGDYARSYLGSVSSCYLCDEVSEYYNTVYFHREDRVELRYCCSEHLNKDSGSGIRELKGSVDEFTTEDLLRYKEARRKRFRSKYRKILAKKGFHIER